MRRVLIVNPMATGVTGPRTAAVTAALAAAGPIETLVTEGPGHATELARSCDDCSAVYVFAGDGGFNEAVNGLQGAIPAGFIPGGATSVLPRALGLPPDPVEAARRVARAERRRRISLGRVTYEGAPDGRRFTFCAGLGLDAELVRAVDARGRRDGKRPRDLAFVAELCSQLWHRRGLIPASLEIDGHGRCALAVVTNCDPYTYAGPLAVRPTPRSRFELGLDLLALPEVRPRDLARLAWWLLAHPVQERSDRAIAVHDADRLAVGCDAPTALQVDGEDMGDVTWASFEAERDALTVLV